jgi:mRNA-degrading endonuclease RelE of RelBE toxin-antitoxin system
MLFRKGKTKEAKLAYLGHVLIDTKSRVVLGVDASPAHSAAERAVGLELLARLAEIPGLPKTRSAAADKGYGSGAFLASVAALGIEPHITVPGSTAIEELPSYSRPPRTLEHARAREEKRRDAEARNAARRLSKTRRARLSQRLRTRVEHVHAEAKQHHGLARARLRGLRKVRSEVRLVATVQNLKRLANRRTTRGGRASAVEAAFVPRRASIESRPVASPLTRRRMATSPGSSNRRPASRVPQHASSGARDYRAVAVGAFPSTLSIQKRSRPISWIARSQATWNMISGWLTKLSSTPTR